MPLFILMLNETTRWWYNEGAEKKNMGETREPINPSSLLEQRVKPAARILTHLHQHFAHCTLANESLKTPASVKNRVF